MGICRWRFIATTEQGKTYLFKVYATNKSKATRKGVALAKRKIKTMVIYECVPCR